MKEITFLTKFSAGDKVWIIGNTNHAYADFMQGKDCEHYLYEHEVKAVISVHFTHHMTGERFPEPRISYNLIGHNFSCQEDEIFLTRDQALSHLQKKLFGQLQYSLEQNQKILQQSRDSLSNDVKRVVEANCKNITELESDISQLKAKLDLLSNGGKHDE